MPRSNSNDDGCKQKSFIFDIYPGWLALYPAKGWSWLWLSPRQGELIPLTLGNVAQPQWGYLDLCHLNRGCRSEQPGTMPSHPGMGLGSVLRVPDHPQGSRLLIGPPAPLPLPWNAPHYTFPWPYRLDLSP